jgi:hypothetical protein
MAVRSLGTKVAAVALLIVVGGGLASGCSGQGPNVSCTLTTCTVTFDRGVDAKASVLGIDVKLVSVDGNQVTVDVGGNRLDLPIGGSPQASGGGLNVSVQSVTADKVVVQISRS